MGMGRPSIYTPELAERICEMLSNGMSMRQICKQPGYPSWDTIWKWIAKHEDFAERYARAREKWAEAQFELLLEISDDGSKDTYEDEDGKVRTDHEVVARSRLRVDTLKWVLSKLIPKKYGERIAQDIDLKTTDNNLSDEQRAARIQAILDRAAKRASQPAKSEDDISDLI